MGVADRYRGMRRDPHSMSNIRNPGSGGCRVFAVPAVRRFEAARPEGRRL
jgi:hypothetical protein